MRYAFDLHLHSCLSPCGDEEMTPGNLAGMCKLAGLDIVALTDHNTCGNCASFCAAAEGYGLLALPGMELCTREEVHVVCLLPDLAQAAAFGAEVYSTLDDVPNRTDIFGPQSYMDAEDCVVGEELRMLAGASAVGIYEVAELVARYGGVAYPAHVDRQSFSLLSNLGLWDPTMGFPLAELSYNCPTDFIKTRPDLEGIDTITGSDAHYLHLVQDACQWMELAERTPQGVVNWLKAGGKNK